MDFLIGEIVFDEGVKTHLGPHRVIVRFDVAEDRDAVVAFDRGVEPGIDGFMR